MKIDKLTEYIDKMITKRLREMMCEDIKVDTVYIPFIIKLEKHDGIVTLTISKCLHNGMIASEWIKYKILELVKGWNSDRSQILDVEKECKR